MALLWSKWLSHKIFHCSFFFNCFYCEMPLWRVLGTISHSYGIDLLNLMIGLYLRYSIVYEQSGKLMKKRAETSIEEMLDTGCMFWNTRRTPNHLCIHLINSAHGNSTGKKTAIWSTEQFFPRYCYIQMQCNLTVNTYKHDSICSVYLSREVGSAFIINLFHDPPQKKLCLADVGCKVSVPVIELLSSAQNNNKVQEPSWRPLSFCPVFANFCVQSVDCSATRTTLRLRLSENRTKMEDRQIGREREGGTLRKQVRESEAGREEKEKGKRRKEKGKNDLW